MAKGKKKVAPGDVASNRQASYRYEFLERMEAGLVLTGTEVKSLRTTGATIKDGFATIKDGEIWGPTDVYTVNLPLPGDSKPLVLGEVLEGMSATDRPLAGKKNDPMMPVAWAKTYTGSGGKPARVFTTTMGAATDLQSAGLRRLLVNAAYWAVGLEDRITPDASVATVGPYEPRPFGFGGHKKGVKPEDHAAR